MTTPEGKVKAKLRKLLSSYTEGMYTYWPVPSGYGKTTLDVLGCYRGRFFSVETKAAGKKPTLRQAGELQAIGRAMGRTFVLIGENDPEFHELWRWLNQLTTEIPYDDTDIPSDEVRRRQI